jgi:hypothetical protein
MPRRQGSFSQLMLFLMVFKNATHFGAPKYPKRFVNLAIWLLTIPRSSKKQRQLFCSFLLNESLSDIFTKPLRFRFGSASCPIVQLFFLILPPLGIDGRASVRAVLFQSKLA